MKREGRYVVLKLKDLDLANLTDQEKQTLSNIGDKVNWARTARGAPRFSAAVVEGDWPEYEIAWHLVECRVDEGVNPLQKLGALLSVLLDEDQWAECERLLLDAGVVPPCSDQPNGGPLAPPRDEPSHVPGCLIDRGRACDCGLDQRLAITKT